MEPYARAHGEVDLMAGPTLACVALLMEKRVPRFATAGRLRKAVAL